MVQAVAASESVLQKESITVALIGPPQSGKSNLIGKMMISQDNKIQESNRYKSKEYYASYYSQHGVTCTGPRRLKQVSKH